MEIYCGLKALLLSRRSFGALELCELPLGRVLFVLFLHFCGEGEPVLSGELTETSPVNQAAVRAASLVLHEV